MSKQERQEQPIKEIKSPAFESGFFNGMTSLQSETYNCKKGLDSLREAGYNVNRNDGNEYILGWKYAHQIFK